ncbi:MAG: sigma-70 family RNA polymerase sigma factor [Verrucomicrobiales bacterium]|nr:sigma-70 family RNA polymerase sigma factor [Verrucomicrobiales bacterium]
MVQTITDMHEQFTRCWTTAQPIVASFLLAAIPDFHEAEDLLQNVSVVCLRKFLEYDAQRPFTAWALGIARIELLRHRRLQSRLPLLREEQLLDEAAEVCEELAPRLRSWEAALGDCLRELRGRSAELVRLRYEEALKPAAIAERLGMGSVAVRVALSRVRATLRRCIEQKVESGHE